MGEVNVARYTSNVGRITGAARNKRACSRVWRELRETSKFERANGATEPFVSLAAKLGRVGEHGSRRWHSMILGGTTRELFVFV